jgi:hypothetical protein
VLARNTRHGALRNNLTASGSSESIGRIGSAIRSGPWQSQAFLFEAGSNKMNRIALQPRSADHGSKITHPVTPFSERLRRLADHSGIESLSVAA